MLVTPDFANEDSQVNKYRNMGFEAVYDKVKDLFDSREEAEKAYKSMTHLPQVIKPGLIASANIQDAIDKDNYQWLNLSINDLFGGPRIGFSPYGFFTEENQIEGLLFRLQELDGEFFVASFSEILDKDKPYKMGVHLTEGEEGYRHAGKEVFVYEIWERKICGK